MRSTRRRLCSAVAVGVLILVRPGGLGITKTADNVPGALLLIDWLISEEGQSITASLNRTPANTKVSGGLDPGVNQPRVNLDVITNESEREKWRLAYEDIVRQTGKGTPVGITTGAAGDPRASGIPSRRNAKGGPHHAPHP
jgi:ABC-type glycerol-3-phosphate transport system substrate-binding protein